MRTALSLRIARLLLVAAAAFAVGTGVYIAAASQEPLMASPWIALLVLVAAGFVAAAVQVTRDVRRARLLALGSAIGMGALGTLMGFGAGMLSFPAAGTGVLAAWATFLSPPRRPVVMAFVAYLAIGMATVGPAIAYPLLWATALIWPARLLLFPAMSVVPIYLFLGIAGGVALTAFVRRRPFTPPLRPIAWAVVAAIAVAAGAAAVLLFRIVAELRTDTSARFELDPVVLALVFLGGAVTVAGALALYLRPSAASALALGLGAAALFMTLTYRPAVTCHQNGTAQGLPLAWALRAPFEQGEMRSSGSSGTSGSIGPTGPGAPSVSTGRFQSGGREAVFRCEGDRLIEYRETTR